MDKWIISKLNTLIKEVDEKLENYDITTAALKIEAFTDELSNWYVRRNRERFWSQELTDDKIGAYVTLYEVLVKLVKISAPWLPTRLGLNNVQETQRGFLSTLWNVYSFYVLYAEIDQFNPIN